MKDYSESVPYNPTEFADNKSITKKEKKSKDEAIENADSSTIEIKPVLIPVSVFSNEGKLVQGLQKTDFKVFVNEQEQEFSLVETKDEPLNIILLIDTSASTTYKIEEIQNYALSIVGNLKPQDRILVIEFNMNVKVLSELTTDRQKIEKVIRKINFGDGTSLYEAVSVLFQKHISTIEGRKAVILLTDGVDTTSINSTYVKSLVEAEKYDAPIFPIYFDTLEINKNVAISKDEYKLGKQYLNDLVSLSGGRAIDAKNSSNDQKNILGYISEELRLKYYLKIQPSEPIQIGQRKQIKVRVNRPDLFVLARGSYIVGRKKTESLGKK
ncbi:MAG: VWA domain-containing protein [Actinomycetota bacterium]